MNNNYFSSEDFLVDVKHQIKIKYNNQESYAEKKGYSRKALNRILNDADNLPIRLINDFCCDFDLKIENYLF